jgi:hypothetical protein
MWLLRLLGLLGLLRLLRLLGQLRLWGHCVAVKLNLKAKFETSFSPYRLKG